MVRPAAAGLVVAAPRIVSDDPFELIRDRWEPPPWPGEVEVRIDRAAADDPEITGALETLACPACHRRADHLELDRIARARVHYAVTCAAPPGWPPLHLWALWQAVSLLAERTGGLRLDPHTPRLIPAGWRPRPPTRPERFAVGDWARVLGFQDDDGGTRLHTAGMHVFGLPDLEVRDVRPDLCRAWARLLLGLARALVHRQWADLAAEPARVSRVLPGRLEITASDVAAALAEPLPAHPARRVAVSLRHATPVAGSRPRLAVGPPPERRGPVRTWHVDAAQAMGP
ncbi:hypothetical protein D5H75_13760 [Bailinhaonella thermotolerans]|uniref:Uncharacterized protein n=1 Tax=Bailinhaonella thermotolerans TaxID=1070861 RepID=A0A3A4AV48_9ACTN|nr:hypothetical protein D5H75_13760 [Bailinhaonella thermotolerans]